MWVYYLETCQIDVIHTHWVLCESVFASAALLLLLSCSNLWKSSKAVEQMMLGIEWRFHFDNEISYKLVHVFMVTMAKMDFSKCVLILLIICSYCRITTFLNKSKIWRCHRRNVIQHSLITKTVPWFDSICCIPKIPMIPMILLIHSLEDHHQLMVNSVQQGPQTWQPYMMVN